MLDQSNKDSEPGSVRHLTHEDLEAYATGRLAAARSISCQTHLDSCEACRAELEDLRAFRGELASFSRPQPNTRELGPGRRRRGLSLPLAASIAAIFVAAVSAVLWIRHEKPPASKTLVATPVAPPPAALTPTNNTQTNDTRVAAAAPSSDNDPGSASKGFALLGPVGTTTSERRPQFSWQPLPGAIRYSVAIVDARLHPVQRSPALRTTVWRPRRPLRRGRTYLWQVTATLRGGSKVVASSPGTLIESADDLADVPGSFASPRVHQDFRTSSSAPILR